MITTTKPTTRKDTIFPTVSTVQSQISNSEQKLKLILIQEKNLGATRQALLKLPETEENNKRLNELKIEIVAAVSQKNLTEERLTVLKTHLPEVQAAARQNESDLTTRKKEVEQLLTEIIKIDSEITKALQKPIQLIQSRKQIIESFEQVGYRISKLTGDLRWHPPAPLITPPQPAAVTEFQELFPPRVVRWRGRGS